MYIYIHVYQAIEGLISEMQASSYLEATAKSTCSKKKSFFSFI